MKNIAITKIQTTQKRHRNDTETTQKHTNKNDKNIKNDKNNKNICVIVSAEKPKNGGAENLESCNDNYTDDFIWFWEAYPRQVGKGEAYKCWKTRLKEGSKPENIIAASKNYADECKLNNTETQFIKHPKTFLSNTKPFEEYVDKVPQKYISQNNKNKANVSQMDNYKQREYSDEYFESLYVNKLED